MKSIIVGFSKPKTWKPFAWVIMKAYGTPYDHVYVKFHSDSFDRDLIYQASGTMINFMSPDVFESNNFVLKEFTINVSDDDMKKTIQFAIDNAGKPYSMKEVLGLAVVRIAEIFGKKIKNPWADGTAGYVCCILVAYILQNIDDVEIASDVFSISPKELYEFLMAR